MDGLDSPACTIHPQRQRSEYTPATKRFAERFGRFNFAAAALRPAYGMAEAMVYIATRNVNEPPEIVDSESRNRLRAKRSGARAEAATKSLVVAGVPRSQLVRIVDPHVKTSVRRDRSVIWVAWQRRSGYWHNPRRASARLAPGLSPLRRAMNSKRLAANRGFGFRPGGESRSSSAASRPPLIAYGRNHAPDDIEATIQEITSGRCAAIAVPDHGTEKLVDYRTQETGETHEDVADRSARQA